MASTKYLKTFFAEKNLDSRIYEINDSDGNLHLVDSELVIDCIHNTSEMDKDAIADTIRKIDFANGDVHHFLKHLANALVSFHI